jgi:hypothetical protein
MTIKGKVVFIEQVDFNHENKRATYELLTDNSSSGRLYLDADDRVPKEGDSIFVITDSDGNAINYAINE